MISVPNPFLRTFFTIKSSADFSVILWIPQHPIKSLLVQEQPLQDLCFVIKFFLIHLQR
jgi:hypothetical protein